MQSAGAQIKQQNATAQSAKARSSAGKKDNREDDAGAARSARSVSDFMGIMDFIQPDDMGDVFAEMGVSRAAPV